jgi:lipopolysaccharide export system permease protein
VSLYVFRAPLHSIIDKYILKDIWPQAMFIPIGIVIDVSEKVNKMIENKVPLWNIAIYYHFHDLFCQFFIPDISIFIDYLVYLKTG